MNKLERLQSAPIPASSAESLAAVYGFGKTLDEYAASLPPGTRLIDVGAGFSDFALEVARRRPDDVECAAYDFRFRDGSIVRPLRAAAAAQNIHNILYLNGDILHPPKTLLGEFSVVTSAGLLEHMLRIRRGKDRSYGQRTLEGMLGFASDSGKVILKRPPFTKFARGSGISRNVVQLHASASEEMIGRALTAMTIAAWAQPVYDAMDNSRASIFKAGRFEPGARGHVFSEDGGQTVHRFYSVNGLALTRRFIRGFLEGDQKFSEPPELFPDEN